MRIREKNDLAKSRPSKNHAYYVEDSPPVRTHSTAVQRTSVKAWKATDAAVQTKRGPDGFRP